MESNALHLDCAASYSFGTSRMPGGAFVVWAQ